MCFKIPCHHQMFLSLGVREEDRSDKGEGLYSKWALGLLPVNNMDSVKSDFTFICSSLRKLIQTLASNSVFHFLLSHLRFNQYLVLIGSQVR